MNFRMLSLFWYKRTKVTLIWILIVFVAGAWKRWSRSSRSIQYRRAGGLWLVVSAGSRVVRVSSVQCRRVKQLTMLLAVSVTTWRCVLLLPRSRTPAPSSRYVLPLLWNYLSEFLFMSVFEAPKLLSCFLLVILIWVMQSVFLPFLYLQSYCQKHSMKKDSSNSDGDEPEAKKRRRELTEEQKEQARVYK